MRIPSVMTKIKATSQRSEAGSQGNAAATPSRGLVSTNRNSLKSAIALNMPPLLFNDSNIDKLLPCIAEVGNLSEASVMAFGVNYAPTIMRAAEVRPDLRKALDVAGKTFSASIEKKLRSLVFEGSKKYVMTKNGPALGPDGQPLFNIEVDGRLLTLLLRRYDRSFNEQKTTDVNLNVNAPDADRFSITAAQLSLLTSTEINALMSIYRKVQSTMDGERLDEHQIEKRLSPLKSDIDDAEYTVEDDERYRIPEGGI